MSRDIDRRVAVEVMGMEWPDFTPIYERLKANGTISCSYDEFFDMQDAFNPSESIADAWLVVEKMTKENGISLGKAGDNWECCISTSEGRFLQTGGVDVFATADTAPMAICLAALKAVEGKNEPNTKPV